MDIVLAPGLWLDAASWQQVADPLAAAGHRVHALTLPGTGRPAAESSEIGMADWVRAVVDRVDEQGGDIALVGHSGGGNVVWGAADARAERIRRVIFVDTVPPPPGSTNGGRTPTSTGRSRMPGWCASAPATGRSSARPSAWPRSSSRPRRPERAQCPIPRPPSTGMTAPEM